jgi:hypothetical protein
MQVMRWHGVVVGLGAAASAAAIVVVFVLVGNYGFIGVGFPSSVGMTVVRAWRWLSALSLFSSAHLLASPS